jgi:hypothetical protein
LALGLAVLAAEQVRGTPVGDGVYLAVGAAGESADRARAVAGAVLSPARKVARRAGRMVDGLPGRGMLKGPLGAARERMSQAAQQARLRGATAVGTGRADAVGFLNESVDGGLGWAQREVVPQVVDGLVPHLVSKTLPQIIEGALPEIRVRILPVVVDDLATDPKIRDLVTEQGRGMLGEAATELRSTTASADDRLESAFLRLLHRPPRRPAPDEPDEAGVPPVSPAPQSAGTTTVVGTAPQDGAARDTTGG